MSNHNWNIKVVWGTSDEPRKESTSEYQLASAAERDAFLCGADAMMGWSGYELVRQEENGRVSVTLDRRGGPDSHKANEQSRETFTFGTPAELEAFVHGLDEAEGRTDYAVINGAVFKWKR